MDQIHFHSSQRGSPIYKITISAKLFLIEVTVSYLDIYGKPSTPPNSYIFPRTNDQIFFSYFCRKSPSSHSCQINLNFDQPFQRLGFSKCSIHAFILKKSTNTLCFCSLIRKLTTFEILRWTRGGGFSKWRSFNSFSREQSMYCYSD